jgi:ADP-ribosylglycohydrolase
MKLTNAQLDRICGVLLGTAADDALGAAFEFGPPRGPELEVAMVGGGSFGWEPGECTDDISMAIAIAEVAASPEQSVNPRSRTDRTREISAEVSLRGPSRC